MNILLGAIYHQHCLPSFFSKTKQDETSQTERKRESFPRTEMRMHRCIDTRRPHWRPFDFHPNKPPCPCERAMYGGYRCRCWHTVVVVAANSWERRPCLFRRGLMGARHGKGFSGRRHTARQTMSAPRLRSNPAILLLFSGERQTVQCSLALLRAQPQRCPAN